MLPRGIAARNNVLAGYKVRAKQRNIEWNISDDIFYSLITMPCHYCGDLPSNVRRSGKYNGDFVYNGIDRVDNNLGYIQSNCVPCCITCNKMKLDMSLESFLAHIQKISQLRCV